MNLQRRSSASITKLIRGTPLSNQPRRIPTKCNFNKVTSTLRCTSGPRGSTFNTRQHRKPTMPKQAPRPMPLIHSHEIMKLRIFTDLNRRKGTFPKQMTITIRCTAKPTKNRLPLDPTQQKTIPDTPNHNTPKQCHISFPNMRRIKELQGAMDIQHRPTSKNLSGPQGQQQPCHAKHRE